MDTLKTVLTTAPALMLINYSEEAGKIFYKSNTSLNS
jgi:hypothetical protein